MCTWNCVSGGTACGEGGQEHPRSRGLRCGDRCTYGLRCHIGRRQFASGAGSGLRAADPGDALRPHRTPLRAALGGFSLEDSCDFATAPRSPASGPPQERAGRAKRVPCAAELGRCCPAPGCCRQETAELPNPREQNKPLPPAATPPPAVPERGQSRAAPLPAPPPPRPEVERAPEAEPVCALPLRLRAHAPWA